MGTIEEFLVSLPASFDLEKTHTPVSQVRTLVRKELALAVASGVIPTGTKFSVRGDYNTMNVDIVEWHGAVFSTAYMDHLLEHGSDKAWSNDDGTRRMVIDGESGRYQNGRYSADLNRALWYAERIANRHNYDNSRSEVDYFDVGYYLHVEADTVSYAAARGIQLESDPKFATLVRDAAVAAQCVGEKVVDSICGRRGLQCAGAWSLGQLIKVATKADGYPLTYSKTRRCWVRDTDQPRGVRYVDLVGAAASRPVPSHPALIDSLDAPKQDLPKAPPSPPQTSRCFHNRTQDGGRMYIDPTVFCLQCGASRKMASATWSDGHA